MALFLWGASDALAAKSVLSAFGEFTFPGGVAVNQTTGDVYAVDASTPGVDGGQRIKQFSADGELSRTWGWGVATGASAFEVCSTSCLPGLRGAGMGQFDFVFGNFDQTTPQVAVDPADGSVYVADNGNNRVQKFSSSGGFIGQFGSFGTADGQFDGPLGVAVDPGSGDVYVADANNHRVQRFTDAGTFVAQVGVAGGSGDGELLSPRRVAVDSGGRLYVLDSGNARIQRFTADGTFDGVFGLGVVNVGFPGDLAVDPGDDHVYAVGSNASLTGGIVELAPDGTEVDVHAVGTGIDALGTGLTVRSSTGRLYASSPFDPKAVLIIDDVTPPTVSIDAVTDVGATVATFGGSVNPQGPPNTSYRFEYSRDGNEWTRLPESDVAVGSDSADVPVAQTARGLEPNTDYRVRLVATKDFNAASATSAEMTFATDAAAPLVRPLGAQLTAGLAAQLAGEVNPQNSATSAYVEYTLASDEGYANSARVPAAPQSVDAGAGGQFVTVSELATGLLPGQAYRFRLVATNEAGTTFGPDRTFATGETLPPPPAGRGYEMVSPLDKNGGDVERDLQNPAGTATSGASASGDAVAYMSTAQFAGLGSGAPVGQYRSVRTPTGWLTRGISPPIAAFSQTDVNAPFVLSFSDDLSRAVVRSNASLTPGAASQLGGSFGLYRQTNSETASTYDLLSAPANPLPPETNRADGINRFRFAGASKDMRHVAFDASDRQLTSDGPVPTGDPDDTSVYAWSDGELQLVSALPSEEPAPTAVAGAGSGTSQSSSIYPGDHIVSDGGQRIYFTANVIAPGPLYVREHGTSTKLVSGSERSGDDPAVPQQARFQTAKADDGSLALFTSSVKLTDDATAANGDCSESTPLSSCHDDLYLWDAAADEGERLTDLTTGEPSGGGVLGLAAAAADMSRAYFVAAERLAPGGIAGRPNLYLWSEPTGVRHVATLALDDGDVWGVGRSSASPQFRDARLNADGDRLLFTSRARLTATDTGGYKQVYLYDAGRDRLSCVSCPLNGESVTRRAWLFYSNDITGERSTAPYRLPRNLSASGERAFFETSQKLVARDTNGKPDVYMWAEGEHSLISTGKGGEGSEFVAASDSGDDVFFTTRERLVGTDVDNQVDLYDARVDGGFPEPMEPAPCQQDGCQPPPSPRPLLPGFGSGEAPGDVASFRRPSLSVKGLSARQRRALARGGSVTVVARVNKAGRVAAKGTARIGRRSRVVLVGSAKRARAAGQVRLSVRLSRFGRAQLTARGRLNVVLSVRFAGLGESRAVPLTAKGGRGR